MPGAQDFVVGQQSSANYARPLIGFQIGDHLAAFPEQYYQARMRAPVIDPRTGQPTSDPQLVSWMNYKDPRLSDRMLATIYNAHLQLRN